MGEKAWIKVKELHFTKKYFKQQIYDDSSARVRVEVKETPSISMHEEGYYLGISTRYEKPKATSRHYSIAHHSKQAKHSFPHLQFNFHTEEIGQFRIRIDIKDNEEYEKAILGFIYKIKIILEDLEELSKGITDKLLVLPLVNGLSEEGNFLTNKIQEGISKYGVGFDKRRIKKDSINKASINPILTEFLGNKSINLIKQKSYVTE